MRGFIVFLSVCLGVLVIPDGFFSRDGIVDTTTAASIAVPVIDMADVGPIAPVPQEEKPRQLPDKVTIVAPYYSQAPDGNRNLPRSQLCSEANLVLAASYIQGKDLDKDRFKQEMLAMIPIQEKAFGTYFSIPMHDLKSLYDTMYPGVGTTWMLENPSLADMQKQLAQGRLIIAPTAGRMLNNPHFGEPGPRFHTILIRGYDEQYFYVNEVGMTRGENYRYPHHIVMDAIQDFVPGNTHKGAKRVMVIGK